MQVTELQQQIALHNEQLETQIARNEALQRQLQAEKNAQKQIAQTQLTNGMDLENALNTISMKEAQIREESVKYANLSDQSKETRERLENELKIRNSEFSKLSEVHAKLETEYNKMKSEHSTMRNEHGAMETNQTQRMKEMDAERNRMQKELRDAEKKLNRLQTSYADLTSKNIAMSSEIAKFKSSDASHAEKLKQKEEELNDALFKLKKLESEFSQVKTRNVLLSEQVNRKESEYLTIENTLGELKKIQLERDEARSKIRRLEGELVEISTKNTVLSDRLSRKEADLEENLKGKFFQLEIQLERSPRRFSLNEDETSKGGIRET